jgi:hypothetical protein
MNKRGDPCRCIHKFLSVLKHKPYQTYYEDELCQVRRMGDVVMAYAYEISNGAKYRIRECTMKLW